MSLHGPALDQPQLIDVDGLDASSTWLLTNHELSFFADAQSDVGNLFFYRANATYARSLRLALATYHGDALVPIANRYYPGYQETILGSEGLIVSKRVIAPLQSAEDRALLWQLECQAEGDTLMRMEVEIDWGEPLTQRLVDGLLVAQRDPQPGKGVYGQSSAASTRIFGNPLAPPYISEFDDAAGSARLAWFVLVNGEVDVELLLTLSEVGEQMAWNGFLALRDSDRAREQTGRAWQRLLGAGRLWTPDGALNHKVNAARRRALQHLVRWKPGFAPADREIVPLPHLFALLDSVDPVLSRNLLAHLRRLAERTQGRLPRLFPTGGEEPQTPTPVELAYANYAYLKALHEHLQRHPSAELIEEHYAALSLCAETLILSRPQLQQGASEGDLRALEDALRQSLRLATLKRDGVNAVRWESEACEYKRVADELKESHLTPGPSPLGEGRTAPAPDSSTTDALPTAALPTDAATTDHWRTSANAPAHWDDPWAAAMFASESLWRGIGYTIERNQIRLKPRFPKEWDWWAVQALPTPLGVLTAVWDGATLHANLAIKTSLPFQQHARIDLRGTDELDFDPRFIFTDVVDGAEQQSHFRLSFYDEIGAGSS